MASRSSADKLKPLPPDPDRHQHSAIPQDLITHQSGQRTLCGVRTARTSLACSPRDSRRSPSRARATSTSHGSVIGSKMTTLYVDADACPVKDDVYRVAARYALPVFVVSNSWIRVPREPRIELVVVEAGPGAGGDRDSGRAGVGGGGGTAGYPPSPPA